MNNKLLWKVMFLSLNSAWKSNAACQWRPFCSGHNILHVKLGVPSPSLQRKSPNWIGWQADLVWESLSLFLTSAILPCFPDPSKYGILTEYCLICCRIWSWSSMPCEKHGPRDSVDKNRGRRPRFLSLLRPEGHVFHTAWETMIKSYYSTLTDWYFLCFYSHKYEF